MRYLIALAALTALTACGVDGAPIQPSDEADQAPARNATAQPDSDSWISGTASMHTATTL
ncbi:MAG TPA: hypothetical protein VIN05_11360 [Roseovarius sp.]